MKALVILIAMACAVAGCAETMQERMATARETCASYGYADNPQCMMYVDQIRQERKAARDAQRAAILMGYSMSQQQLYSQPAGRLQTTCVKAGAYTSCY